MHPGSRRSSAPSHSVLCTRRGLAAASNAPRSPDGARPAPPARRPPQPPRTPQAQLEELQALHAEEVASLQESSGRQLSAHVKTADRIIRELEATAGSLQARAAPLAARAIPGLLAFPTAAQQRTTAPFPRMRASGGSRRHPSPPPTLQARLGPTTPLVGPLSRRLQSGAGQHQTLAASPPRRPSWRLRWSGPMR
jgi:hypothetical protein